MCNGLSGKLFINIQIPFSFEVMHLGLISSDFTNKYLFRILTIASKKAITRNNYNQLCRLLKTGWYNFINMICFSVEVLLDLKLYWGTGPHYFFYHFFVESLQHNPLYKLPLLNPLFLQCNNTEEGKHVCI